MSSLNTPDEALRFLKKIECPENILQHVIHVSKVALEIAEASTRRGITVDAKLVKVGALLHDAGRTITHNVNHGVVGAALVRSGGFPEPVAQLVQKHVGAGIPAEEAWAIGMPKMNYIPETVEEKIVSYADKLIQGTRLVGFEEALKSFRKTLGSKHPAIARFKRLHEEISNITGGSPLGTAHIREDS